MPIVTRIAGTCPVCQRLHKLTGDHKMVHHGYLRPGIGQIIRDCFGVGWPPYELSSDGCKAYEKALIGWIADEKAWIARLERREPATFSEEVGVYGTAGRQKQTLTYRRDSDAPSPRRSYAGEPDRTENDEYERIRVRSIDQAGSQITMMNYSLKEMRKLIANWAPAPLIEIDEEGNSPEMRRERDERRAKKEAERAERERERAARREKAAQREEAKRAQYYEFKRQLAVLASWPPSENRRLQAARLNGAMRRFYKNSSITWQWEFGSKEDRAELERNLVKLGLGYFDDDPRGREFSRFHHHLHIDARGRPEID